MSERETKQAIVKALAGFVNKPLADAATAFFEILGYRSEKRIALKPNTAAIFVATFANEKRLNPDRALISDWKSVDFLFQLTDDEIRSAAGDDQQFLFESKDRYDGAAIESYLFFAITLAKPHYTRTELAGITRAVNRLFPMPALLLFRHGNTLTLAIIPRRLHKRDESKDVLEKVTLIKDICFASPHRAHIEILEDLSLASLYEKHQPTNFRALQNAWQRTLDTSILNQRFYLELANWYFWALDEITFPKDAPKDRDGHDSLSVIRLITRLIFCWFLKEKGLIPADLFQEKMVRTLLNSLEEDENTYYTAILQNLFFATLNTEMDQAGKPPSRRFIDEAKDDEDSEDHMVHQVWRYADRIKDKPYFEGLMRQIPFLNGGLFECLDERIEKRGTNHTREVRVDGFSVKPAKQPKIPNFLFFGPQRPVDLSKAYGELRYTQTKVWPLVSLLERYKFTVSENTPIEEEIALDPELLGHVFENLLAAYNPETDTTARKTTGSFYTPRVVVDFMVDESLIAYLESNLPDRNSQISRAEELRQLLAYTAIIPDFAPREIDAIVDAIDQVKILDPACGSGAFPMGSLHKLVFILGKLDPGNAAWKERQLAKARQLDIGREAAEDAIEDAFDRDQGDYARKLYLIENCLYGVDIQSIAVQIAKLRCFISLIVEQEPDDKLPNRGILPLPNLETKFIAANTLFGLHRRGQMELVAQDVESKKAELRAVRHEHFRARRFSEKKALRKRDKQLRVELADLLRSNHLLSGPEAEIIASWDPYHADRSAPVFDPEWMFNFGGRKRRASGTLLDDLTLINETRGQMEMAPPSAASDGFDIVIGNPPYVRQEELKKMRALEGTPGERPLKEALKDDYFCYTGVADLFVYFYEKAFDLLAVGGVLCFISSNKYFRAGYGERLRHFLAVNGQVRLLIDFGDAPVFTAVAYPSIVLVRKARETRDKGALIPVQKDGKRFQELLPTDAMTRALIWEPGPSIEEFPGILASRAFRVPQRALKPDGWTIESPSTLLLLQKLHQGTTPLAEYVQNRFYNGVKSGHTKAFIVDRATKNRLVNEHESSACVFKPYLRGRDLKRWCVQPADLWLIYIPWHFPLHEDASITCSSQKAESQFKKRFPAIYKHLEAYKDELAARDKAETGIRYEWYAAARPRHEIQKEFERSKIIYPDIYEHQSFAWEDEGYYAANTCYFISTSEKWLTGLLNSLVVEWFYGLISNRIRGGYMRAFSDYMRQIPIPPAGKGSQNAIEALVSRIQLARKLDANAFVGELEAEIEGLVAHLYDLTEEEYRAILDDLALSEPVRVGALNAFRETAHTFAR